MIFISNWLKMPESYDENYSDEKELTPQQEELQEECANCERWEIIRERACATKCNIYKVLTKKE